MIRIAHTAQLEPSELRAARALLDEVFGEEMTDHDWDHALGGIHACAWEHGELVGHAAVIQRQLMHRGRALRTGYVEGVAVRAEHQRRGHGTAMMAALESVIARAYELGALGASEQGIPLYAGRGWLRWRGPTSALTPKGVVRTPAEDGSIYVLPVRAELDLDAELTCDWRRGDAW